MPGASSESNRITDQASEYAEKAKESGSQVAERAQEQVDKGREEAAGGMQQAADKIREQTAGSDGLQAEAGTKIASGMETAASYLRDHSTADMWNDLERMAKEHPARTFAGVLFAGFVLGRILR